MIAVMKKPGEKPETIEIGNQMCEIAAVIGGAYEVVPALAGAMVLCRAVDIELPDNCHFLGRNYRGPILIVGRGEKNKVCSLPRQLHHIVPLALGGGKK